MTVWEGRCNRIDSHGVNDVDVLSKAADAAWQRNELLVNNYSNANTPGYKRKDIDFSAQLRQALGSTRYEDVDSKVARVADMDLEAKVYTDSAAFSYRLDGNNVDPDTEGVELASNQIFYNGLRDSINQEFANLKMVIK